MLLQPSPSRISCTLRALRSVDYIQRFIFPGSFIPSITALSTAICRASDLKVFHLEDIGPHYARTLAEWRRNFQVPEAEVRRLGYELRFHTALGIYLCYCEGGCRAPAWRRADSADQAGLPPRTPPLSSTASEQPLQAELRALLGSDAVLTRPAAALSRPRARGRPAAQRRTSRAHRRLVQPASHRRRAPGRQYRLLRRCHAR